MNVRLAYRPPKIIANGEYLRIAYRDRHGRRRFYGIGHQDATTPKERTWLLEEFTRRRALDPDWPDDAPPDRETLTLGELVKLYLAAKERETESGRITVRSLLDLRRTCNMIEASIPKSLPLSALTPDHFGRLRASLAKRMGPNSLKNCIVRIRGVFYWAHRSKLIADREPWGPELPTPHAREIRLERAEKPSPTFNAEELRRIIKESSPMMRTMVLLGINCAMGNRDVAKLSPEQIKGDVLNYPRNKTGVERRSILWPETIAALTASPPPFLTDRGAQWVRDPALDKPGTVLDPLGQAFVKVCEAAGCYQRGRGFYGLRHTFRTVADSHPDSRAIDLIMGHETSHTSRHYVHRIDDARLRSVSDHVREWLFGSPARSKRDPNRKRRKSGNRRKSLK